MHTLYRVGSPTGQGLWYEADGEFNPLIKTLSNAKCRDMPMGHDPDLVGGWISATDSLPGLSDWFSHEDALELKERGYTLQEFVVTEYRTAERYPHAVFQREAVIEEWHHDLAVLLSF